MTEFIMPHMPSPNVSLLFSFQYLVYHQTHGIYHATYIGGGAIFFFWGGGALVVRLKLQRGKRMLKPPFCALHCICCKKWGAVPQTSPPPGSTTHDIWITCFLFISTITLWETAFFVQISCLSSDLSHLSNKRPSGPST